MEMNRRAFLAGAAATVSGAAPSSATDFAAIRADFPWAAGQTFLNSAGFHPLRNQSARAIENYLA